MDNQVRTILSSGLAQLGLQTSRLIEDKLVDYLSLLQKWNRTYNLVAKGSAREILIRHILDSLSVAPFLTGPEILDFGSGAGLPGIPLAIVCAECNFYLLDATRKKTIFLEQVKMGLDLANVTVVPQRMEQYLPDTPFNTVVTRATTNLAAVLEQVTRVVMPGGQVLIMKGKYPQAELTELKKRFEINSVVVPYLNEPRHLVRIPITYEC